MTDIIMNSDYRPEKDSSFPIKLLQAGINDNYNKAENAAKAVYKEIAKEYANAAVAYQKGKKDVRYILDLSDRAIKDLEKGKIKLTTENGGKTYAQFREINGQYGKKVPVKRQVYGTGLDPVQAANAMQLKALQQQVEELTEQVVTIDLNVQDILQGQQNDRIGLYFSGLALYLESRTVQNLQLHEALVAQALRALSEATFQLTLELQSDIRFLVEKQYEESKKKKVELIDQRMEKIGQSFAFIYQSSLLRAAIYCCEGELPSMAKVLDEYSYFIDETIAKNANYLIEYDKNDDGTDRGIWKTNAKLKLDVGDITKQLNAPNKVIYLGAIREAS